MVAGKAQDRAHEPVHVARIDYYAARVFPHEPANETGIGAALTSRRTVLRVTVIRVQK